MRMWTLSGRCPCGGTYEDRIVEVRLPSGHESHAVIFPGVPSAVCSWCNSRVYPAPVLRRLELAFGAAAQTTLPSDNPP
jgi:hypothetical protein